jgi:hypothetical protein
MLVFNDIPIGFRRFGGHFAPRLENATVHGFIEISISILLVPLFLSVKVI